MPDGYYYRIAFNADIPEIRELWQLCFDDPDEWVDWYLSYPFSDTLWLLCRDAATDRLASMIHLRSYETRIRGVILKSVAYCGFATHPDYRGRGLITDLIMRASVAAHQRGAVLGFHSPNKIDRHHCVLHFTCADVSAFTTDAPLITLPSYNETMFPRLWDCYCQFAQKYSCIVERSGERMKLRIADFLSDGGSIIYTQQSGELTGYAMHHGGNAEEVVFLDDTSLELLKSALKSGVLPPKYGERREFSVMNAIDMPALMRMLPPPCPVRIIDNTLPWNSGVYGGVWPVLETDSGHYMQLLNGYRSVHELLDEGHIEIYDKSAVSAFDKAFPKQNCYVFEKY